MARISLITTCKGRLAHLQESLPRMLAQPDCECIVVDYDCPQGAASWVACNHPGARIVKAEREPLFRPGHARNLGAAAAVAPWLAFVDADTLLAPDYVATIFDRIAAGGIFTPGQMAQALAAGAQAVQLDAVVWSEPAIVKTMVTAWQAGQAGTVPSS